MKHTFKVISLFLFISLLVVLPGCEEKGNPTAPEGTQSQSKIETGTTIDVGSITVSTAGGTFRVAKTGTSIDGMEIIVPLNSYQTEKTFSISYAEVKGHQLGTNFNPISPLIIIKNGGGYSSVPMTIVVPFKKTQGVFSLGYLYNEVTGTLEALPLLASTDSSITITLSHFETSNLSLGKRLLKSRADPNAKGNIIIASIDESILNNQTIINTGFQPGIDDWEFINYGSYIAPGGHCAGQSMSSMWYYYEKKMNGAAGLFHQYDLFCDLNIPGTLWQDNSWGYRYASTIQEDFHWGDWMLKVNIESYVPSLVWKAFIAAMLVTGEPQFVIIKNSSTGAGHAMIVYKINVSEGKLYIADPNYPNNKSPNGTSSIRTISYLGGNMSGSFQPYPSALNANSSPLNFDQIAFFGKTANINWSQIETRWNEFQNKTIGNDRFPVYDLMVKGTPSVALTDGIIVTQDTLKVYCKSTAAQQHYANTDGWQPIKIFDTDGNELCDNDEIGPNLGLAQLPLKPGKNTLGFYIMCVKENVYHFVDFKWITVTLNKLSIASVNPDHGVEGTTVTITGTGFKPTQGASYVQFNGIATTAVSSWSDTIITVQVPQNTTTGDITVVVDGTTSNGISFTIDTQINLNGLDLTTKVQVFINGETVIGQQTNIDAVGCANTDGFSTAGSSAYSECQLNWTGTIFRVNGVHVRSTYQRDSIYISGTVSADGRTILSVDVAYRYYMISSEDGSLEDEETISYTLTNVPLYMSYGGDYSFLTMSDPASRISNFSWGRWTKGSAAETGIFTTVDFVHVDFE